jgi:dimethylamine monooxygenase subunit C
MTKTADGKTSASEADEFFAQNQQAGNLFQFITGKQFLFIIDEPMILPTLMFIKKIPEQTKKQIYILKKNDSSLHSYKGTEFFPNEATVLSSTSSEEIYKIFESQFIGTKLFLSVQWSMLKELKKLALRAGFNEDEIQAQGWGEKEERVFCIKCYHLNKLTAQKQVTCEKCHASLEVSRHYSRLHDAYLGYLKIIS